jgi:hypothetical protein
MFVRRKKNKSGSVSVQLISKSLGKYEVIKTIGSSFDTREIDCLVEKGKQEIQKIKEQPGLFVLENDILVENFLTSL